VRLRCTIEESPTWDIITGLVPEFNNIWFWGLPLNEQYVFTSEGGCLLVVQNDGLLTLYYLVEPLHLCVATYDVSCDTVDTFALNKCGAW